MDITKVKNNLVVSSNDLVHAKYDLTLWQKRVFVYAISQLEKEDAGFEPIRMNVSDIIKFFNGSDGAKTYTAILEAPKNLDKTIEIPYITEKGFLRYGFIKLLQRYTIPGDDQEDNQYIEICFNNDLRPHLLELKEKFLKYDIRNVIELQSTYSFRMFEILKSYEFRKSIELDIDYLRKILEVMDKYKSYKDFRIYIIDKAKQDLTKFCDITFSYEERKALKGKKVESLIFHIYKNETQQKDTKDTVLKTKKEKSTEVINTTYFDIELEREKREKSTEEKKHIIPTNTEEKTMGMPENLVLELSPIVIAQFGVSLKVFMGLAEQYTEGEIRQAVAMTQKAIQTGKVDNKAGFFVGAVRNYYQDVEQQKKQAEADKIAEKKAKAEAIKRVEETVKKQKEQAIRNESNRKMNIIKGLIQTNSPLISQAVEDLSRGIFSRGYDPTKTIEANLENAMFAGGLMNALQKIEPSIFK